MKSIYTVFLFVILFCASIQLTLAFPRNGANHPPSQMKSEAVHPTPLPKYQSVQIRILTSQMDTLPILTLAPNQKVHLPSQGVSIMATDFYSDWKIKKTPINASKDVNNPAVKLLIMKGDSILYESWAFKNIPFFGANNQMGHKSKGSNRLYFTLIGYEGLKWEEENQEKK